MFDEEEDDIEDIADPELLRANLDLWKQILAAKQAGRELSVEETGICRRYSRLDWTASKTKLRLLSCCAYKTIRSLGKRSRT